MKKTAVIFGAGEPNIKQVNLPADCLVWAADGGLAYCNTLGITPDFIIGDFDSLGYVPENAVILPVQKDLTDLEAAVTDAEEKGCDEFYIYGGTGGDRLDHTLANLQSLLYLRRRGVRGWLYDRNFLWTAVENEELTFRRTVENGLFSAFCLGDRAEGIDLEGFQYSLQNGTLTPEFPLGVSNHMVGETLTVRVRSGALALGWELPAIPNIE